jgi:hypothetical protein
MFAERLPLYKPHPLTVVEAPLDSLPLLQPMLL